MKQVRAASKVKWRCAQGHEWIATVGSVLHSGSWCPVCVGRGVDRTSECVAYAKERSGKMLSPYHRTKDKIKWRCKYGHEFSMSYEGTVSRGCWCQYCAGKYINIEDCRSFAKSKGGKCISEKYKHSHAKMMWECEHGHQWEANFTNIKMNKWCPKCANRARLTIEDFQRIAKERGGRCLSTQYIPSRNVKLEFECAKGHRWSAISNNVKRGSWCKRCATSRVKK